MKAPANVKLMKAEYVKDYIYRFEYSNGKVFETDFRPIILSGEYYKEYLDITKFKKMKIRDEWGDIYWGKNWDLCFHLEAYYGETKVLPISKKIIKAQLKKVGILQ